MNEMEMAWVELQGVAADRKAWHEFEGISPQWRMRRQNKKMIGCY